MPKGQKPLKIKRYRNTFNSGIEKKRTALKLVFWTLLFAAIFAAAFFLAKPLTNLVKNAISKAKEPSSSVSEPAAPPVEQPSGESEAEKPAETVQPHGAAMLDASSLGDPTAAEALAKTLSEAGITEAVVTLKDAAGTIYYPSGVAMAASGLSATKLDGAALVKVFQENGVTLSARIYAYRDPLAAAANRSAAVNYRGQEGVLWLDNARESGGKPWLNPYSADAQQYILDLTGEIAAMGFQQVVVDAVQYPAVYSLDYTGYGAAEGSMTKEAALSQMVQKLNALADEKGVCVTLEYPETAVRGTNLVSYLVSPVTYGAKSMLIDLDLAADALPDTGALTELVNLAKQNGIEQLGARISKNNYSSAAFAAQKQAVLDAGFQWVAAG